MGRAISQIMLLLEKYNNTTIYQISHTNTSTVTSRDNSPLSEWIAYGFDITVLLVTERILPVFVREAKVL